MRKQFRKTKMQNISQDYEVRIRIHKTGRKVNGKDTHNLYVRFSPESHRKASSTNYVGFDIDNELGRMYFVSCSEADGYKLIKSGKNCIGYSFTATISDRYDLDWDQIVGSYNLMKDTESGDYYIDFSKK